FVQPEQKIRYFCDHVRVLHFVQDRDDHGVVQHRLFDGIAEYFEILVRHPRVFDLGQTALIGVGVEELTSLNIFRGGFTTEVLGLGIDAVKEGGGNLAFYVNVCFLQVFGQDRRGGAIPVAEIKKRHGIVGAISRMVVDDDGGGKILGQGVVDPSRLGVN